MSYRVRLVLERITPPDDDGEDNVQIYKETLLGESDDEAEAESIYNEMEEQLG